MRKKRRPTPPPPPPEASAATPEWRHWLLWAVAVFPICWRQITTSDCWWSVALGRWLAERRGAPDFAQLYFTPVRDFVPDLRWTSLGHLVLYAVHTLAGPVGLQMLSVLCLVAGCALLRRLRVGPMNGWCTALLVAVAVASYQLQLPRGALFSLPLTTLLFWLFARFRATRRAKWAWLIAALIAVWGVTHGSYLLGFVLATALLGVDALEGWREGAAGFARRARLAAAVLVVAFASVAIGNPATVRMLRQPVAKTLGAPERAAGKKAKAAVEPKTPEGLKEWLNNLIWRETPGQVRSADFSSPLDRLDYHPVAVTMALLALGAAWAAWARGPQWPWIAAFAATAVLGLGYFRMSGYAALATAALIFANANLRGRVAEALGQSSWLGAAAAGIFAALVWGAWGVGKLPALLGNSRHIVAPGKVPVFDDAACDWLLAHHRERRVFTTIVTGSYALQRWHGAKPVFIDGFFAPHAPAVMRDYVRARREPARPLLRERYGIELALVETTRIDWNALFLNQPGWQPAALGRGCIVYQHESVPPAPPVLLAAPAEIDALPLTYRRAFARNYYAAILALLGAERSEAARAFADAAPDGYRRWRELLAPQEKAVLPQVDTALGR